jgi:hypothetical protein
MSKQVNNRFRLISINVPADTLPLVKRMAEERNVSELVMVHEIFTAGLKALYTPEPTPSLLKVSIPVEAA